MTQQTAPLSSLHEEADRILERAAERGVHVRVLGGLAVWMLCPSAREAPLLRPGKDVDLVGLSSERQEVDRLLADCGYVEDREFNLYHGHSRMIYFDEGNQRNLDVFLDELKMCHALPLKERLALSDKTLTPADLLLSKLQIVALTDRDLKDATALLADAEIDEHRVAEVLAADWGWWRTATGNLDHIATFAGEPAVPDAVRARALARIELLRSTIAAAKKSLKWKTRARVGERVRWYELPEESIEEEQR